MMTVDNSTAALPVPDEKNDHESKPDVSLVTPSSRVEPIVTRRELWSYYLYPTGGSGFILFAAARVFQSLATVAGYDPIRGPGSSCLSPVASGKCVVPWGNGTKTVGSVVLLANGIGFSINAIILTVIGPAADYGSFSKWPLLVASLIGWGSLFSMMSLTTPSRWGVAMGLYTVAFVSFGATYAFYMAIFPRLARNTRHIRELKERYELGEITADEYRQAETLEKSKISCFSNASSALGNLGILLLELAILIPLQGNANVNNYFVLLATAVGVMASIWWFIFEQPRPGPNLPEGEHYLLIGWKRIWVTLKQCKKLPNTFVYMFAYFFLADGVNTTIALVQICQNAQFRFSFLKITYLNLVELGAATISQVIYWYIQRYWKIDSKKMFLATCIASTMLPLWGMIGIWTDKFGYHSSWEFWVYNVIWGLFQAPYFSFSQTVMADLCPPGFDFMFFGLFGLTNRASSIVGPNVIQAIIDKTGNIWHGFAFLFATCLAPTLVIWLTMDVPKGRRDAERWAAAQRGTAYDMMRSRLDGTKKDDDL